MRRGVKRKMEKADKPSTRLIDLFLAFARVGMLTFGGGVAMLPMLERECVQRFGWVNNDELTDYFAIGQCTPGIIAVNTATFVGSKQRGALGAAVATLGVISPSIVIILIIAAVLNGFADNPYVIHAFAGIRAAVCALMVNAVVRLCKSNVRDWVGLALAAAAFVLTVVIDISPVFPVLGAAILGIFAGMFTERGGKQ